MSQLSAQIMETGSEHTIASGEELVRLRVDPPVPRIPQEKYRNATNRNTIVLGRGCQSITLRVAIADQATNRR